MHAFRHSHRRSPVPDTAVRDGCSVDIAMVLCDERWLDPDQDMTNGYDDITTPGDLLRLESVARSPPSWLATV